MTSDDLSRRSLLQALAAALGGAALPAGWVDSVLAEHRAHALAPAAGTATLSFLSATDAADIEAVTAQLVPTDDTPGAREAGVVHFIDRALATFLARLAGDYRAQLAAFQSACRTRYPEAASFAALSPEQQVDCLTASEQTPFFETTRVLTLLGMFSLPAYGGNRDGVGWRLLGFEDAHAYRPPFGYYDRDYPGFVADRGDGA